MESMQQGRSAFEENDQAANQEQPNFTTEEPSSTLSDLKAALLHEREQIFVEKHRSKIRICDPKSVYLFRHITPSWFATFVHFVTMLCSSSLLVLLFWAGINVEVTAEVEGVGHVSELTFISMLELGFIFIIISTALYSLSKNLKLTPIKRYWLAMYSNAINRTFFKYFKLSILLLALITACSVLFNIDINEVFEKISNGLLADILQIILAFISVVIFYRAFSFCHKEL